MSFICHTHNYTEYKLQWNVFSAFNASKRTHTHTPGAMGSRHSSVRGAVGGSVPCSRVSPQSWTIPAGAEIQTHNLGLQVQHSIQCPTIAPCAYEASRFWSARTTLRPLRTSTDKVVYAPVACCNSPATSSSGVRSIWDRFTQFTFRACSTRQPMSCHELRSPESGDSIPRRSSWFGDVSDLHR